MKESLYYKSSRYTNQYQIYNTSWRQIKKRISTYRFSRLLEDKTPGSDVKSRGARKAGWQRGLLRRSQYALQHSPL